MRGDDDPWKVLGIPRDASDETVRAAYRDLAKVWHPDRFAGESDGLRNRANRELQRVNAAYEAIRAGTARRRTGGDRPATPPGSAREAAHRRVFALAFWVALAVLFLLALRFGLLFRQVLATVVTLVLLPVGSAALARVTADAVLSGLASPRRK